MPGNPEEPGPNPLSCDTDCSQSREWDHQGCLRPFQERDKTLVATVDACELQGPPGSSLLWSVTWMKVL